MYWFLKVCLDYGQPFGRLTESDWLALLKSDTYGTLTPAVRSRSPHPFLSTLYLLGCFSSFHHLHRCGITDIARTVFGEARLRVAHSTVVQALTALGYNDYSQTSLRPL